MQTYRGEPKGGSTRVDWKVSNSDGSDNLWQTL